MGRVTAETTPSGGRFEFGRTVRGYNPAQVERCLRDLAAQLAQAEAHAAELQARVEQLLTARHRPIHITSPQAHARCALYTEVMTMREQAAQDVASAQVEAAAIVASARAQAVQNRRDFGSALAARRQRERDADAIYRQVDSPSPGAVTASDDVTPDAAPAAGSAAARRGKQGNQRTSAEPTGVQQPNSHRRKARGKTGGLSTGA